MPSISPGLLPEEIRASEARQEQRMNTFREEFREEIGELKEANRALGEKLDRFLEMLLAAKT